MISLSLWISGLKPSAEGKIKEESHRRLTEPDFMQNRNTLRHITEIVRGKIDLSESKVLEVIDDRRGITLFP